MEETPDTSLRGVEEGCSHGVVLSICTEQLFMERETDKKGGKGRRGKTEKERGPIQSKKNSVDNIGQKDFQCVCVSVVEKLVTFFT